MSSLRSLIVALLVAVSVAGCATPDRPAKVSPPVVIPESTWRQIDRDIVAVSLDAKNQATHHARDAMQSWRTLVYQRTGTDFIPWFSGYWTRQWLTMKVTWYKLSAGGERDPTVDRLADYLQGQYQDRVLEPVARESDPDKIMEQTTKLYIWLLGELLQRIPQRYGVPLDQFNRRLQGIPAIALAPPPTHSASLYQITHAEPVGTLPAYVALVARIRNVSTNSGAKTWSSNAGLSSVAKRTSERLASELVTRGVASSVSLVVGRAIGMMISLGMTGFTLIVREKERPEMEAQFRKSLNVAFDEEWRDLIRDPDTGVLAGVYYISGQIEGSLTNTVTLSIQYEPIP
ncbi:hypothetical protein [Azotobacter salinestris]|uniref:hypothetical protein n=1 Tax=Azotobacter salinestris TaxID=69964 RepID=UPI0032DEF329